MPEKKTTVRAQKDRAEGKSASTQAGAYVKETMDHIRAGEHGARSTKQAMAIGLSKARRAGVKLKPPAEGKAPAATRREAEQDLKAGASGKKPSAKRAAATTQALEREPKAAASKKALSKQARGAARQRTSSERSASAKKAARTRKKAGS